MKSSDIKPQIKGQSDKYSWNLSKTPQEYSLL